MLKLSHLYRFWYPGLCLLLPGTPIEWKERLCGFERLWDVHELFLQHRWGNPLTNFYLSSSTPPESYSEPAKDEAAMRAVSMLSSCHASFECHDNFNTQCRAQLKTTLPKIYRLAATSWIMNLVIHDFWTCLSWVPLQHVINTII